MYHCPRHGTWTPSESAIYPDERACQACMAEHDAALSAYRLEVANWEHWMYRSGIPRCYRTAYFSNFQANTENRRAAIQIAHRYCQEITRKTGRPFPGGYWLHGPTGRGKTHLLCSQITHACISGIRGQYATWRQLVDSIFSEKHAGSRKLPGYRDVKKSPLLALDAVCAVRSTEWEKGLFSELIDRRHSEGLPTIFAAVAPPDEIQSIPVSTLSQIKSVIVTLPLDGPDYRQVDIYSNRDVPAIPMPETPTKEVTYASPPKAMDKYHYGNLIGN